MTTPHPFQESSEDRAVCAVCEFPSPNARHRPASRPAGIDRATASAVEDQWWWRNARQALRSAAASGRVFDPAELETVYGVPPPAEPNHWGALLRWGKSSGLLEEAGYAQSSRASRRGGTTRLWRGARSR